MDEPSTCLNEFDKEEWRLVARQFRPDWSDEDFDEAWAEFAEMKRLKGMH
jgi:hypothetical protein